MSKYFQWAILSSLTGSPVLSIVILVVIWWSADRATFRFLPDPLRFLQRWRRMDYLRRAIHNNPHDRRARFELADLLIERHRYAPAVELLKPNLEADAGEIGTLYLMGVACLGSGRSDQGEIFLEEARSMDATYRLNAIDLELGRWRLARGEVARAREVLERFCAGRHGTVEGKVLLSKVLQAEGDVTGAAKLRQEAWLDYLSMPAFQRRQERFWAWRARPSRPLTYAAIALICGLVFAQVVSPYFKAMASRKAAQAQKIEEEE